MAEIVAELDAGDVLVIGAGVTGTLLALRLLEAGIRVTVIDRDGFGAAQSGHSHGYLHHGHIYRGGERWLVEHLQRGAASWGEILDRLGIEPLANAASICFSNEVSARAAASWWREAGLPVNPVSESPTGIRDAQVGNVFSTTERTYDFSSFFKAVAATDDLEALLAEVREIERSGDQISSVTAEIDGRLVRINARAFVLAAGDQNAVLAETATRFRGRAMVRTSLMAVLAGERLPPISVVMPENETYGLFIVSRPRSVGNVWLTSNFISFGGERAGEVATERWLYALVERLVTNCSGVADPDIEWGLYEAPKGELRSAPQQFGAHAAEDYALRNLLVLAPTKLTLAPLLVEEVAEDLLHRLRGQRSGGGEPLSGPHLDVCEERWRSLALAPAEEFFSQSGRESSLSRLRRYARPRTTVV